LVLRFEDEDEDEDEFVVTRFGGAKDRYAWSLRVGL
jgi:hypothetical protein